MTTPQRAGPWRKSTYSNQDSACVEIAPTSGGGALVRDTKHRQAGYLTIQPDDWRAMLAAAKAGRLDR
jgi:hypothetical protein